MSMMSSTIWTIYLSPNSTICKTNLAQMSDVCKNAGFNIQHEKVVGPCEIIEFLGIEIATVSMTTRITQKCLDDIMN